MSKLLILSGGSRGIGKAALAHFVEQGWQAINLSRSNCGVKGVIQYNIDLGDAAAVDTILPELIDAAKASSQCCLVHNASLLAHDAVGEQNLNYLLQNFQISIVASAQLNNALVKHMPSGSSIGYIGSTLSEIGVANCASYVTLKHATVGMMRASCQDLAGTGIHSYCICPGFTDTEMLREHLTDAEALNWAKSRVGDNRLITPEEIVDLLWFSANNPVINGAVLHANLGQLQA